MVLQRISHKAQVFVTRNEGAQVKGSTVEGLNTRSCVAPFQTGKTEGCTRISLQILPYLGGSYGGGSFPIQKIHCRFLSKASFNCGRSEHPAQCCTFPDWQDGGLHQDDASPAWSGLHHPSHSLHQTHPACTRHAARMGFYLHGPPLGLGKLEKALNYKTKLSEKKG